MEIFSKQGRKGKPYGSWNDAIKVNELQHGQPGGGGGIIEKDNTLEGATPELSEMKTWLTLI
jgi:hypothetical protein